MHLQHRKLSSDKNNFMFHNQLRSCLCSAKLFVIVLSTASVKICRIILRKLKLFPLASILLFMVRRKKSINIIIKINKIYQLKKRNEKKSESKKLTDSINNFRFVVFELGGRFLSCYVFYFLMYRCACFSRCFLLIFNFFYYRGTCAHGIKYFRRWFIVVDWKRN